MLRRKKKVCVFLFLFLSFSSFAQIFFLLLSCRELGRKGGARQTQLIFPGANLIDKVSGDRFN
jgi:hypothetical protein